MSYIVPKVYCRFPLKLFIVYMSQIQAKGAVLTLNIDWSLVACPQQLELNHIIASYSHDDKDNNYELRIKVTEKWRMRVISSASNIRYWSLRFLFITFCSDGSLSTRSYILPPACSLNIVDVQSDTIYFSHVITRLILTQGKPNVTAYSSLIVVYRFSI